MKRFIVTTLLIIISAFQSFAGDPDLFYFVADGNDNLYSVNRVTGTVTNIGATGVTNIESIAYYPIPGANQLFAANGGDFGSLNLTTGTYTSIADIDAAGLMNGALGPKPVTDVDAMMLDGQTFKLWAAQRNSPNDLLFQIDPVTGLVVRSAFGPGVDYIVVSGPGINVDVDDIAINPVTGRMYAANNDGGSNDNLIEINKFNAIYTIITALSEDDVEGTSFHNDGKMYGSEGDTDRMSEINLTTGAMTNQITLAGGDVEALASLVADANTVSGTVYNDDDLDATLDGGETGVEGVTVYLYIDVDNDGLIDPEDLRVQTTTTDSNGDYEFYYASTANLLITTDFSSYPASSALTTDNIESAAFTDNVNFAEVDANNNFGIGTGPDCDGDGLPNFFEGGNDSDFDAIADSCDLDSDNDGILDSVEGIQDFDNDGLPNYTDRDSDDDGIPDAIEGNQGTAPVGYSASNGNVSGTDADGNGIVDAIETSSGSGVMIAPVPDSDNDGKLDYLDLDSDNDGILDIIEAGGEDSDRDGQVDGLLDANSNGLDDRIEATPLAIPNTDVAFETTNSLTLLPNYIDIDSDSDGIDDTREGYSTADYDFPTLLSDVDSDGIVDFWDVSTFAEPIIPYDRDSDDIPDYIDDDSDNDGISDLIEGNDLNADGVVDIVLSGVDDDNNGLDDALDDNCGEQTVYATANDYGEERVTDGVMDIGSTDLELCTDIDADDQQIVGIRFSNVAVDQGANITSAFIQFEVDEVSTGAVTITISGELDPDAAAFTTTDDDISDRTPTVASETWSPADWNQVNEVGSDQRTVDISDIIEEIVGQGAWVNGNSLVITFSAAKGNARIAENDPLLIINTEFDATPTLNFTAGDYAEEDNGGGTIDLGSSDLELPNDGGSNQTVGVLFSGVTLEQGQIVTSAYLQFEADEVRTGAITLSIEGELASTANTYSTAINDVSSRTTTTSSAVSWSPTDWNTIGEAGVPQQTPDLSTLVQEIINQPGWVTGNNLSFIITGPAGNRRTAETDPVLVIETTASFSICASSVVVQDFDGDGESDFRDTDDDADGIPTKVEPTDDDASGTVDYLESDTSSCGLGFVPDTTIVNTTNTTAATGQTNVGVTDPANALGVANGTEANIQPGESLTLDFGSRVLAGSTYDITWSRQNPAGSGSVTMTLEESEDGVTFVTNPTAPATTNKTLFTTTITTNSTFQFLRITSSSPGIDLDAVVVDTTFSDTTITCLPDNDNDRIADVNDIDDDNDGILDVDEGCAVSPAIVYATYESDLNTVVDATQAAGAPDGPAAGTYAQIYDNSQQLILDFEQTFAAGTQYVITWRRRNDVTSGTATIDLSESTAPASGFVAHPVSPDNTDNVNFTKTIVTSNSSFRYLAFDKGNSSIVDYEIDAVGVLACTDTDGDGVPDSFDLDSDNDGIPDIQEAGGVDTDQDGRVDDSEDTDGDGWANVFDSDNGGTALQDGDKDGDGLENRIDLDADNDGIADIVEAGGEDADGDGRADDITDTDNDGFANVFDNDNLGTPLPIKDQDGDGLQNYLDLDSDNDGIIDNIEGQTTAAFQAPLSSDTDGDGWDDRYDSDDGGTAITLSNNEGFGEPDYLDDDSDGDGKVDWVEGFDDNGDGAVVVDFKNRADNYEAAAGNPADYVSSLDTDSDGLPDFLEDDDSDNVPNFLDPDSGFYQDDDNDGLINLYDADNFGFANNTPTSLSNLDLDTEPDFRDADTEIELFEPDADNDGIPDIIDIDDDNDGILDIDENEGCPSYVVTVTSSNNVTNPGNITGAPDGSYAELYENLDNIVLDFQQVYPIGSRVTITWRRRSGAVTLAQIIVEESVDNISYITSSQNPSSAVNAVQSSVLLIENTFRYLRLSKNDPPSATDWEIDAVSIDICDTDSDGIPDQFDLDSDNDGIPDIVEAGGVDADNDGRVDGFVDSDGDGWANTFDSDDGGTPLTDGDQDGDGFKNRLDLDSDDDGLADIIEAGGADTDNDGRADVTTDGDDDGWANLFDGDDGGTVLPVPDTDGDGTLPNYLDLDSDNDGIIDNIEWQTTADFMVPSGTDANNNGWDDEYDDGPTPQAISNNDGAGDGADYIDLNSDTDSEPDWLERADDDEDGDALLDLIAIADAYELANGNPNHYVSSDDADADGIPDFLESAGVLPAFLTPGNAFYRDTDNDGLVDFYDSDQNGDNRDNVNQLGDVDNSGDYDFRDATNDVTLPIELIKFTATKVGNYVQLDWSTATEINNDYFTIEKSTDGENFEYLLTEDGAGNSSVKLDYRRYDEQPEIGYNYYKLTQTDFNGESEEFNIEVVKFDGVNSTADGLKTTMYVYPNPTEGAQLNLRINQLDAGRLRLELMTTEGQLIRQQVQEIESETRNYEVEVLQGKFLAAGTYYLRVITTDKVEVLPFIVK